MESFVQKHGPRVMGVLSGFDRLVFRGKIRQLAHVSGVDCYLAVMGVLLKDFGKHAQALGQKLKAAVTARVQGLGRPVLYLPASSVKQPGARTARDDSPVELQAECHRQNAQPARERWQQACRACPCVGCEGYRTEYRGQRTKDDTSRVPRPYDCAEGAAGLTRIGPGASGVTPNSRASQPGATGGLPMRFAFEGEARGPGMPSRKPRPRFTFVLAVLGVWQSKRWFGYEQTHAKGSAFLGEPVSRRSTFADPCYGPYM